MLLLSQTLTCHRRLCCFKAQIVGCSNTQRLGFVTCRSGLATATEKPDSSFELFIFNTFVSLNAEPDDQQAVGVLRDTRMGPSLSFSLMLYLFQITQHVVLILFCTALKLDTFPGLYTACT